MPPEPVLVPPEPTLVAPEATLVAVAPESPGTALAHKPLSPLAPKPLEAIRRYDMYRRGPAAALHSVPEVRSMRFLFDSCRVVCIDMFHCCFIFWIEFYKEMLMRC